MRSFRAGWPLLTNSTIWPVAKRPIRSPFSSSKVSFWALTRIFPSTTDGTNSRSSNWRRAIWARAWNSCFRPGLCAAARVRIRPGSANAFSGTAITVMHAMSSLLSPLTSMCFGFFFVMQTSLDVAAGRAGVRGNVLSFLSGFLLLHFLLGHPRPFPQASPIVTLAIGSVERNIGLHEGFTCTLRETRPWVFSSGCCRPPKRHE